MQARQTTCRTTVGQQTAERRAELTAALQEELRRSDLDAALLDITPTKSGARYALKQIDRWMKPRWVPPGMAAVPGKAWIRYELKRPGFSGGRMSQATISRVSMAA